MKIEKVPALVASYKLRPDVERRICGVFLSRWNELRTLTNLGAGISAILTEAIRRQTVHFTRLHLGHVALAEALPYGTEADDIQRRMTAERVRAMQEAVSHEMQDNLTDHVDRAVREALGNPGLYGMARKGTPPPDTTSLHAARIRLGDKPSKRCMDPKTRERKRGDER